LGKSTGSGSHPVRVAWHVAYDNLVFHARFKLGIPAKEISEELKFLDGAMFPAFLPGIEKGSTFVFADTLGFHTVGMVLDNNKEPKAAMAILARVLKGEEMEDLSPTVGNHSSKILGDEIIKYLECHESSRLLSVHALRPGDGLTIARSLGNVYQHYFDQEDAQEGEEPQENGPAFVLELYPSKEQRDICGKFISGASEKRRSGTGYVDERLDGWMRKSLLLPGGNSLPSLRWARKRESNPENAANLAVAFDTYESKVEPIPTKEKNSRPIYGANIERCGN
jgi:DNA phosphorothioation-dependent restriction protein DptH